MKVVRKVSFAVPVLLAFTLVFVPCSFADQDVPEGKDHPLLSRMPGYFIRGYSQSDFDSFEFTGKGGKPMVMEGRKTVIEYKISEGAKQASPIQIFRNCQNALAKNGGKVIYELIEQAAFGKTTLTLSKGGQEAWVNIDVGNRGEFYNVAIVEKQGMKQDVVSAATWRDEIRSTGHTAVYGIYFDTDKADLRPESDTALQEIAKLLGQDASLKLMVVGHTDLSGDITHNMQLSERRAKAVLTALTTRFKIAPPRLTAYGVGPLCPVAPNDTEEGRARNRRVELVKR